MSNPLTITDSDQVDRFRELACELGCDEDEAAFEAALKKVAESLPIEKQEPDGADA